MNFTRWELLRNGLTCLPLSFFILSNGSTPLCDPLEADLFWNIFEGKSFEEKCPYCLPDCEKISYKTFVTTEKFRQCDEQNFRVSRLCDPSNFLTLTQPYLFYNSDVNKTIPYISPPWRQSLGYSKYRFKRVIPDIITRVVEKTYNKIDAYNEDIAKVSLFFDSNVVLVFNNQLAQNWIFFLSNAAGIFGLFIGITLMTVYELIWWSSIILLHLMK